MTDVSATPRAEEISDESSVPRLWLAAGLVVGAAVVACAALLFREIAWRREWLDLNFAEPQPSLPIYYLSMLPAAAWRGHRAAVSGFHPEVFVRWASALAALAWLAGVFSIGRFAARRALKIRELSGVLEFGIGFTLAGVAVLGVGLAGIFLRPLLTISLVLVAGLGVWETVRAFRRRGFEFPLARGLKPFEVVYTLILLVTFLYALAPPTQSDGIRYHLGALTEWRKAGGIVFFPHLSFASFPFLVEMHYFAGFGPFSDPAAAGVFGKVIHWGLFVASLQSLAELARYFARSFSDERREAAVRLARFVYASTPAAAILAGWSFIDHGIVFLFLATLLAVLHLSHGEPLRGRAIIAGCCAGGLLGTKYTMLLPAAVFALGVLWLGPGAIGRRAEAAMLFVLTAALLGSPWFLKNLAQTGNPIYPASVGGRFSTPGWSDEASELLAGQMSVKATPPGTTPGEAASARYPAWQVPWRLIGDWDRFEAHFLGLLPILALAGLFAGWIAVGRLSREAAFTFLLGAVFLAAWWLTYPSARLLLPAAALGVLPLAWLAARFWNRRGPLWLLWMSVSLHAALGLAFLWYWLAVGQQPVPLPVALGLESRDSYLTRALNYYPYALELNERQRIDEGAALLLGEHRPYYFEGLIVFADWFNPPVLAELFDRYRTNEEMLRELRADGVRFVFFNREELAQYYPVFARRLGPEKAARFQDLVERLDRMGDLPTPIAADVLLEARADPRQVELYKLR